VPLDLRKIDLAPKQPSVVILVSGAGSNMKALVSALAGVDCHLKAIVSNRPGSAGVQWAAEKGLTTEIVDHEAFASRELFDDALLVAVQAMQPDWVFLAGFMRVLRSDFVAAFEGKLVNLHPSLLPAFTGLNTHQRAIDAGVRLHGATVHWVTNELDAGAPIVQGALRLAAGETKDSLQQRVRTIEHEIYPQAVLGLILQTKLPAWRLYD
jgi:phosphoribosylglycinamide formyltransferase 1